MTGIVPRVSFTKLCRSALLLLLGIAASQGCRAADAPLNYESDLTAFLDEVDRTYPFFDLKGIRPDWERTKEQLKGQARGCKSDAAFLGLVNDAFKCLRDAHMGFVRTRVGLPAEPPEYYPGVSFLPATEERVVIFRADGPQTTILKPGTVVTRIDGQPARQFLEARAKAAWNAGGHFSSPQRARLFEYRLPLRGKKGEQHTLTVTTPAGERALTLSSATEARGWPHTYNLPANLARSASGCSHTQLAGGAGYIYLRNVSEDTEPGLAAALAAHPNAKGWIVDLRGNGGGGYDEKLLERLKAIPKPVAVLIDEGCISAGETLARDLARYAGARLLGSTTAGASSAKRTWSFPSGIGTVSLPVRSRAGLEGKPIEFNGIEPDEKVEAVPEETQTGRDSAILRAEEYLAKAVAAKP